MAMYRASWKIVSLFVVWVGSLSSFGQEPTNAHEYDAWKQAQIPLPVPIVITPEMLDVPPADGRSCDCWVTPDASYTTVNNQSGWGGSADDGSHGPLALPFNFQLYGQNYSSAYININGNVSFGQSFGTYSASGFPVNSFAMVAPFWADVDLRGPGAGNNIVRYKITPTAMYVNWIRVGYYSMQTDKLNTFQVIITNGSDPIVPNGANVSFCYRDMQWTTGSASSGVGGFGGTPANVGANKGDGVNYMQFGRFDQPGTAYDGPFGGNDGVDWLDNKYFSFATDITSANVPPVISSQSVCDSMVLCVGQPATLQVTFLSPEPSQTTVATSSAPTLSNYSVVTNTSGISADITTAFTPQLSDVGYHIVTFEATDNGSPVMTTTFDVVVQVQMGLVLDTVDHVVCSNGAPTAMLPLLTGMPAGGTWTAPSGATHSGTFNPAADQAGYYIYSMNSGSGCPSLGTVNMAVTIAPNAGTDNAVALCTSDVPVDLYPLLGGTQDPGGTWAAPSGDIFDGLIDPAQHTTGVYRYMVPGQAPCLNDTAGIAVTVSQAVDPGVGASLTLCDADPVLDLLGALGGAPSTPGYWTAPSGGAFGGTFNPASDPDGVYTYTATAVAPCPNQTAQLTLTTEPVPFAGADATLVSCTNAAVAALFPLLGGVPDGGGYWVNPMGVQYDGNMDPATAASGDHLYVVPGVATCAYLIDTAVVTVTINQQPDAGLPASLTLCMDAGPLDMLAALNGTPDPNGTWVAPGGATVGGYFQAGVDPVGVYTYAVLGLAPCLSESTTLTLATHSEPWAGTDAAVVRCADASPVDLFAQLGGAPNGNGAWQDPAQTGHSGSLQPGTDASGDYLYIVPGTAECAHLIDTAVVAVAIDPLPEVSFTYGPEAGCIPLDVTFTNTTPAHYLGGTSTWTLGDGTASSTEAGLDHTYTTSGHFAVILTVTTPEGCTDQHMQLQAVLAERMPLADFHYDPSPGTEGNSLIMFHADDPIAVAFHWTVDGAPLGDDRSVQHLFNDVLGGEYEVCLRVEDRYGCADSLCKTVPVVVPSVFVPNAFTPDGDGVNDEFLPMALDVVPTEYVFEVFDRWGGIVFSTNVVGKGWDGQHANGGGILPQGVYVWRMETLPMHTSEKKEHRGIITLLK